MTETAKRRRRLSRGALRALAWIAGGAAFAAPFASLTLSPRPATAEGTGSAKGRRVILVRKITRLVVVRQAPETPGVQYVYVGGGSANGSNSGPSGSANVAAAPPPASTTTTGGS